MATASPCRAAAWRTRASLLPVTSPRSSSSTSSSSRRSILDTTAHSSNRRTRTLWTAATSRAASRVQVFTSRSHDPYLNLSAEHFLLQRSHPDSVVLLLYANDPCVVIGRNQNPWVEVDLGLLRWFETAGGAAAGGGGSGGGGGDGGDVARRDGEGREGGGGGAGGGGGGRGVALVRRRSGGGAVFHDRGNVNYSVICPPAAFDRDRHAEMVVRALRRLGVVGARVNERHDIVVTSPSSSSSSPSSSSTSPFTSPHSPPSPLPPGTFKVSGSAYKLTRLRSLHHGTCLLSSPNLAGVGTLLRSPAEPFVKARGVESVRSPIRNVGLAPEAFMAAVAGEFAHMYGPPDLELSIGGEDGGGGGSGGGGFEHDEIQKGYREIISPEWIYQQTPQFTFSTHPTEEDPRPRPPFPSGVPDDFRATITARHGQIQHAEISGIDGNLLQDRDLHQISDWRGLLKSGGTPAFEEVGKWFNHLFGVGRL